MIRIFNLFLLVLKVGLVLSHDQFEQFDSQVKIKNLFEPYLWEDEPYEYKSSLSNNRLPYRGRTSNLDAQPRARIPIGAKPVNYKLSILTKLEEPFAFYGTVQIDVEVVRPITSLTLNSLQLKVTKASFNGNFLSIQHDDTRQLVIFRSMTLIPRGRYMLNITYWGYHSKSLEGFYLSKTRAANGQIRPAAFTQFEDIAARMAFPCWDEPNYKATFDVTLIAPRDRTILSNMPVIAEGVWSKDTNLKMVVFDTSPVMSSYLLAFAIADYDYIQTVDSKKTLIRVFTPIGKTDQGQFALEIANKTLEFFTDYYNIGYPLPKMDLIPVPDFAAGAMENWGLNTYRETRLLVTNENTTPYKQAIVAVIAHEFAHQWFGNLVTMEWWSHIWLNEGFASFNENPCLEKITPQYQIWEQFVAKELGSALTLDARQNSVPLDVDIDLVVTPADISTVSSLIIYRKGSSLIRMLKYHIGEENLRKGVSKYLNLYKYSNTVTNQLWDAIYQGSGQKVDDLMRPWVRQSGYPIITVDSMVAEGATRKIKIRQNRFLSDNVTDPLGSAWPIPLRITTRSKQTAEDPHLSVVFRDRETTITLENVPDNSWISLNAGAAGMYRVFYTNEMLTLLGNGMRDGTLPARDKWIIINDIFTLALAQRRKLVDAFQLCQNLRGEPSNTVWSELFGRLPSTYLLVQERMVSAAEEAALNRWVQYLAEPVVNKLGWTPLNGESYLDRLLRPAILSHYGNSGNLATIAEAQARFDAQYANPNTATIEPDLRNTVYSIVLKFGNAITLDKAIQMYKQAKDDDEKIRIISSICRVNHTLINTALQFILLSTDVPNSHVASFGIAGCSVSAANRRQTFAYLKDYWSNIVERRGASAMTSIVSTALSQFAREDMAIQVAAFFDAHTDVLSPSAKQAVLNAINSNREIMEREGSSLVDYFLSFQPTP